MRRRVRRRGIFLAVLLSLFVALGASACGASGEKAQYELAPESALPDFVRDAPPQVKEAYRFATANPDVLKAFPCYCGCGSVGHMSNLDCYIQEIGSDGAIVFDNHAFG